MFSNPDVSYKQHKILVVDLSDFSSEQEHIYGPGMTPALMVPPSPKVFTVGLGRV